MRFLFTSINPKPLHEHVLDERPFGGGPSSVIHLANALQYLGHEVFVVTSLNFPSPSKPTYIPWSSVRELNTVDVLIINSGWETIFNCPIPYKKCFYWSGESMLNPKTLGLGDLRVIRKLDALLAKSHWQANTLCDASGFPLEKTGVLPNGANLENFAGSEVRDRKRLIYCSTPVRGLNFLPKVFQEVKKKHPEAELYIYSSFDRYAPIWGEKTKEDLPFEQTFLELASQKGCHVRKSILQKDLARELMKSAVLVYPTNFLETCCNLTLEAQAAGCVCVTSDLASLPETVGDAGVLIKGMPGEKKYDRAFIDAVNHLLADDTLFNNLSEKGLQKAQEFDWKKRAQDLITFLT